MLSGHGGCHCKRLTFISLLIVINQKDYCFDYAIAWLSIKRGNKQRSGQSKNTLDLRGLINLIKKSETRVDCP